MIPKRYVTAVIVFFCLCFALLREGLPLGQAPQVEKIILSAGFHIAVYANDVRGAWLVEPFGVHRLPDHPRKA